MPLITDAAGRRRAVVHSCPAFGAGIGCGGIREEEDATAKYRPQREEERPEP